MQRNDLESCLLIVDCTIPGGSGCRASEGKVTVYNRLPSWFEEIKLESLTEGEKGVQGLGISGAALFIVE